MRRIMASAAVVLLLASLAGCALVSDKTKTGKKEEKHQVKVLGLPVWKSEKPVAPLAR